MALNFQSVDVYEEMEVEEEMGLPEEYAALFLGPKQEEEVQAEVDPFDLQLNQLLNGLDLFGDDEVLTDTEVLHMESAQDMRVQPLQDILQEQPRVISTSSKCECGHGSFSLSLQQDGWIQRTCKADGCGKVSWVQ